jgi:hypothetical protein
MARLCYKAEPPVGLGRRGYTIFLTQLVHLVTADTNIPYHFPHKWILTQPTALDPNFFI